MFIELVGLFSLAIYTFNTYLNVRQYARLSIPDRPEIVFPLMDDASFQKARLYSMDKLRLRFFSEAYDMVQLVLTFALGIMPFMWSVSADALRFLGLDSNNELLLSGAFFVIVTIVTTIVSIPTSLLETFVVEERNGFNKTSFGLFVSDWFKTLALTIVIGSPLVVLFVFIVQAAGPSFYFYLWLLLVAVQLSALFVYPNFIQPLFNKFESLPEGSLRNAIEALAKRVDYPVTKIFVVDNSARSSHSNAYLFGFFKNKRIVIFDNLIKHCEESEICGIVGHELGHWALWHTGQVMLATQSYMFVIFVCFSYVVNESSMYREFGFSTTPTLIGFLLFQFVLSPLQAIFTFLLNNLIRRNEYQADQYSIGLGYSKELRSALLKVHRENLGFPNPDPLYSSYHFSHPPIVERLAAFEKAKSQ